MKKYIIFTNLKVAFDRIDRDTLWKLKKLEVNGRQIVRKLVRIYENTRMVIRR